MNNVTPLQAPKQEQEPNQNKQDLEKLLLNLEQESALMAKQDNIKEIIVKYKELNTKVQDARKLLDAVELKTKNITDKFANNINTEISKDNVIHIDQNTYNASYDELQKLINNFYNDKSSQDNKSITDMITEYEKIIDKITVCYNYLKTQKYEIINLD